MIKVSETRSSLRRMVLTKVAAQRIPIPNSVRTRALRLIKTYLHNPGFSMALTTPGGKPPSAVYSGDPLLAALRVRRAQLLADTLRGRTYAAKSSLADALNNMTYSRTVDPVATSELVGKLQAAIKANTGRLSKLIGIRDAQASQPGVTRRMLDDVRFALGF